LERFRESYGSPKARTNSKVVDNQIAGKLEIGTLHAGRARGGQQVTDPTRPRDGRTSQGAKRA